ncbi:MAG TPA: GFA family protein [Gaiellaceae bacterium]|nr:GFA family protein [Gaiellaceae bacterium]
MADAPSPDSPLHGSCLCGGAEPGPRAAVGLELIRVFAPEGGRVKAFCSVCGSSLSRGEWPEGDEIGIRLGALDGDPCIRPEFHLFAASRARWGELPDDGLPRFDEAYGG